METRFVCAGSVRIEVRLDTILKVNQPVSCEVIGGLSEDRLGQILAGLRDEAAQLYGPRSEVYAISGVKFRSGRPRVKISPEKASLTVYVSRGAGDVGNLAQLAHETIHTLAPAEKQWTTNFEEGLAEYFTNKWIKDQFGLDRLKGGLENYASAFSLMYRLMDADPSAVRRLRERQPVMAHLSAEDFSMICPDVPTDLVNALLNEFDPQLPSGRTKTD